MADVRDSPADPALDDLLRPSVEERPQRGGARPWRLGSQFYVAAIGGAAGVTAIALLNAVRLRLPVVQRWAIAGLGVLGLIASAIVISAVGLDEDGRAQTAVVLGRACGVAAWGGMYLIQRGADRVYEYRSHDDAYASLWIPGFLAALAGTLLQVALVEGLT